MRYYVNSHGAVSDAQGGLGELSEQESVDRLNELNEKLKDAMFALVFDANGTVWSHIYEYVPECTDMEDGLRKLRKARES